MRRFALSAVAAMLLVVLGAPAANAGSTSVGGVSITWNDLDLTMPLGDCTAWAFTITNNSSQVVTDVIWTVSPGNLDLLAYTGRLAPDQSEKVWIDQICPEYAADFLDGTMGRLQVNYHEVRPWREETTMVALPVRPAQRQLFIEARKSPCDTSVPARYCSKPWVFMFKDGASWVGYNSTMQLYNRRGLVSTYDDELGDLALSGAGTKQTVYLRPASKDLISGRYLAVSTYNQAPGFSCTITGRYVDCHPYSGSFAQAGYTFTWDGRTVSDIRKVPKTDLDHVRL